MKVGISRLKVTLVACLAGVGLLSFQNCSPQGFKFKGQPGVSSDDGILRHNGGTTTDNPKPTVSLQVGAFADAIPSSTTGLDIFLCVSEIRFEKAEDEGRDERLSLKGAERFVHLNPSGTVLANLDVPVGNYGRIELRLSDECNDIAASVKNANGEFKSDEEAHVRFSGAIANNGSLSRLVLNMDSMISGLANAKSSGDIERILEESEGGCGGD